MNKVFEASIELTEKFASGNEMGTTAKKGKRTAKPRMYRYSHYEKQKTAVKSVIWDLAEETHVEIKDGVAYKLRELYEYPVPAAYLKTKKQRAEFSPSTVLPITRGTSDIDNTMKPMHDAMMDALGFDDSQIVSIEAHKRYKTGDTYRYSFELYEMPSGVELEFY